MRFKLILLLCFGAAVALEAQSPWTRSKAGFYAQAAWHFIPRYHSLFDRGDLPREISENTVQLYGEYGISRNTTLVADMPYRILKAGAPTPGANLQNSRAGALHATGNFGLAIRQKIPSDNFALAFTLKTAWPTGRYDPASGLRSDYDAVSLLPMLSAGKGFESWYGFAYAGYGFRSNHYSRFFNGGLEAGLHLQPFWFILFSELVLPSGPDRFGTVPPENYNTALYLDRQGWASIGFKCIWQINRFTGLVFSAAGAAWAREVPESPGVGLGAFFKWD